MNPYFERMELKESYKDSVGKPRITSIATSNKYTHFYVKLDGTHIDLEIPEDRNNIRMLTREGNDVSHLVPYLVNDIKNSEMPYGVYACEAVHIMESLHNPRNSWGLSRRVLGRKDYDDSLQQIQLVIYDCYEQKGVNYREAPLAFRTLCLLPQFSKESLQASYSQLVLSTYIPNVCVPRCHTIDTLEDRWNELVLGKKMEGFVLFNLEEESCKFSRCFTKLKPPMNVDAVVLGYHLGKKGTRLEGMVGAFEVGLFKETDGKVELVSIGKVPTMPDLERVKWNVRMLELNLSFDKYYKESRPFVIEINASEVTVNNKLRFPSYLREREDKTIEECRWEQIV